jgi:hypothetical protein
VLGLTGAEAKEFELATFEEISSPSLLKLLDSVLCYMEFDSLVLSILFAYLFRAKEPSASD